MRLAVILAAVALCAACTPSINPQMQSATDQLLASVKGANHDEAAPSSYAPQEWAVGQWVLYRVTQPNKPPSVARIGVVAKEGDGFWVETDSQDYYHHTITKVLYARMPRTADEAVDALQKILAKTDEGDVQTSDFTAGGPAIDLSKKLMKSYAAGINAPSDVSGFPKEDLTVPAGSFKGTAKFASSISMGPLSKDVTSWFHPAVPLNGGVKAVSTDGDFTYELLDFGTSGAKSSL